MPNPLFKKHFLSVDQLDTATVSYLFNQIDKMKEIVTTKGKTSVLDGKVIGVVFFEPSTRTFASFVSATQRLGADIVPFHGMLNSSINKGETFEDTIQTIGCSTDAIILRHDESGMVSHAADTSYVPIINAGDGGNEHPSQALLDVYTIHSHFPSLENITVGMVGDVKHSRTIRSLSKVLAVLGVKKFIWIAPPSLRMLSDVKDFVTQHGVDIIETDTLESVIGDVDVLYSNRIQKERFENPDEYESVKDVFVITPQTLEKAKQEMIVMNPLPRVGEITPEVDSDKRAVYMKEQMQNGLYTRMALLKSILSENE